MKGVYLSDNRALPEGLGDCVKRSTNRPHQITESWFGVREDEAKAVACEDKGQRNEECSKKRGGDIDPEGNICKREKGKDLAYEGIGRGTGWMGDAQLIGHNLELSGISPMSVWAYGGEEQDKCGKKKENCDVCSFIEKPMCQG